MIKARCEGRSTVMSSQLRRVTLLTSETALLVSGNHKLQSRPFDLFIGQVQTLIIDLEDTALSRAEV